MAYVGNTNTTQGFTPAVDYFSGNGSTVAFTLSRPVASVAQVQVVVNNVAQNPTDAYTVLNNTITFTGAPSSGTNNIYVYYTSPITQVIQPGQGTVNTASLAGGTVNTSADINANGLTLGKGAGAVSTNTVVGFSALAANTNGAQNTAIGSSSLAANSTASNNTAIGYQAGYGNTTGYGNTFVGSVCGYTTSTAAYQTAIGFGALQTATGGSNTGVGVFALNAVTTGTNNTGIGPASGSSITTGSKDTIIGAYSGNQGGLDIRTSSNNIVLSDGDGNVRGYEQNGAGWRGMYFYMGDQYSQSYTTTSGWSSLQTIIPANTLTGPGGGSSYCWLVQLNWVFSSGSSPYYANAFFLFSATNSNSTGTGNVIPLITSCHVSASAYFEVAPTYALNSITGLAVRLTNFATLTGTLTVKATKIAV